MKEVEVTVSSVLYKWFYKLLPVPRGHVMCGVKLVAVTNDMGPGQYWHVSRVLKKAHCPACGKDKLRGSVLCGACKNLITPTQKRLLRQRLRWKFIGDYYSIISSLKKQRKEATRESAVSAECRSGSQSL